MTFHLQGHLAYQVDGPSTIITSLHAMRSAGQAVSNESFLTSRPVRYEELEVGPGQNRFSRISVDEPGELTIDYSATAETSPGSVARPQAEQAGPGSLPAEVIPYLFPSRYCQSDVLREEAANLFPARGDIYGQVEAVVEWISRNIDYVVGSTEEQTSALEVLERRCGVCRDFAHLAIAFCRALTIPARYTTVYAYQLSPPDFHACFEVHLGGGWYLFDATAMAPLNGLVRISVGRDASDAAVASLFGGIQGTGLAAGCEFVGENFTPVTRDGLQRAGQAFILS
jgi:transglutaminase-like putative cysteine protease